MPDTIFIKNSFKKLFKFLSKQYSSVFILLDENTLKHCYPKLAPHLPKHHIIQIKSGEENKTLQTCSFIWQKLGTVNAGRDSLIINLGGGVIGDMGGFAAGCYKRGITFINVPTTLLAMVDASVGGKTGIDFEGYKNQLGLFETPAAVFINTEFLQTLSDRELKSGFAEVIKHYLITDKKLFRQLAESKSKISFNNWDKVVSKNVAIKERIVKADPYEKNIRKALNFGHTLGHAVETLFLKKDHKKLLHGEAVAAGMLMESFISMKRGLISENELKSICKVILRYFILPPIRKNDLKHVVTYIRQDKKVAKGRQQFTLLNGIGNYSINNAVEEVLIIESVKYYNTLI